MANPEFYAALMRGANTAQEIDGCLKKAEASDIGNAAINNIRRLAMERIRELKVTTLIAEKWHKQHKVNGSSHCQPAINVCQQFDELVMQPDPLGKYTGLAHGDPNAIALFTLQDALRVGYISAKASEFGGREGGLAKWLSARLGSGERWATYVVAKVGQGKASLGLRVQVVQLRGETPDDWPKDVVIESEAIEPPKPVSKEEMDEKLTKLYIYREMLGDEARKEFKKIRAFRVKYGKYSEGCIDWLDTQAKNLDFILNL
jgi:hypothetical protein